MGRSILRRPTFLRQLDDTYTSSGGSPGAEEQRAPASLPPLAAAPRRSIIPRRPTFIRQIDDTYNTEEQRTPTSGRTGRRSSIGMAMQRFAPHRPSLQSATETIEERPAQGDQLPALATSRRRRSRLASVAFDPGRVRRSRGRASIMVPNYGRGGTHVGSGSDDATQDNAVHAYAGDSALSDEDEGGASGRRQARRQFGSNAAGEAGLATLGGLSSFGLELLVRTDTVVAAKPLARLRRQSSVDTQRKPSLFEDRFPGLRLLNLVSPPPTTVPRHQPEADPPDPSTQQGMFETAELKAKRRWLRFKPEIRAQVSRLWDVAKTEGNKMAEAEYLDYHLSASHFLMEEFEDEAEFDESSAWETAMEDWQTDCKGKPWLSFDMFFESVFELADLWTNSVKLSEYVRFIKLLLRRATAADPDSGKLRWTHRWPREPFGLASRQWLATVRQHWTSLALEEQAPVGYRCAAHEVDDKLPTRTMHEPAEAKPPLGKRGPARRGLLRKVVDQQRSKASAEQLQSAAQFGLRALGAAPGADGVWSTVGLVAFKEAILIELLLPEDLRDRVDANPNDGAFGHALFRCCDVNRDGRVSLEDLVEALGRV